MTQYISNKEAEYLEQQAGKVFWHGCEYTKEGVIETATEVSASLDQIQTSPNSSPLHINVSPPSSSPVLSSSEPPCMSPELQMSFVQETSFTQLPSLHWNNPILPPVNQFAPPQGANLQNPKWFQDELCKAHRLTPM